MTACLTRLYGCLVTVEHKQGNATGKNDVLPPGVAGRLSGYLHILIQTGKTDRAFISSQALSEHADVNPTQIRRDLAKFGKFGKRGVGYDVGNLISSIREIIGAVGSQAVALVGAGNLGAAIAGCAIFPEHGFYILAVFDSDPTKIGKQLGGLPVQPVSEEKATVRERGIIAGVLAVPAGSAQEAADTLFAAGVRIVINYSGGIIKAPPSAIVHDINPVAGLLQHLHLCAT